MSEFDTHDSNSDLERTVLTEPRVDVRSFSEKHPFLAHLASKWEVYAVITCLPYTILGAGFVIFGSGIDPIYPMYNPENIDVGVTMLKSAAILWTIYGVAKGAVALIAPIQRFTQGHFHNHLNL